MDWNVETRTLLQVIKGMLQSLNGFVTAVEGATKNPDHANAIFITAGYRFFNSEL